jgi:hypothetical protein
VFFSGTAQQNQLRVGKDLDLSIYYETFALPQMYIGTVHTDSTVALQQTPFSL